MSQECCLGVVRIGELVIAIPAAQLQEVVSDPLPFSSLPDAPPFVRGQVLLHERHIVPVLDLQHLLFSVAPSPRPQLLVFLQSASGRLAILADEVLRVVSPGADQFVTISASGENAALFRRAFKDGTQVINLLEVTALAAYSGVRLAAFEENAAAKTVDADERTFTLFRLGEVVFAVDIVAASHAMLIPPLGPRQLPTPLLCGFFEFRGRPTPLVDLNEALGLANNDRDGKPDRMLAIEHEGRAFAVGISDLIGMEKCSMRSIQTFAACGLPEAGLYRGTVLSPRYGKVIVLNHEALLAHEGIRSLVALHDSVMASAVSVSGEQRFSYIVYRVSGNSLATRMDQLEAVQVYPNDFVPLGQDHHPLLGFFTWHKRVIALMDLGAVLGESSKNIDRQTARVLVVRQGENHLGYLVHRVESLQEAAPKPLPRFAASGQFPKHPHCELPKITELVTVKVEGGSFNASVLDLSAIRTAAANHKSPANLHVSEVANQSLGFDEAPDQSAELVSSVTV